MGQVAKLMRRNATRDLERPERVPVSEAEKARQAMREWLRDRDEDDVPEWDEDDDDLA